MNIKGYLMRLADPIDKYESYSLSHRSENIIFSYPDWRQDLDPLALKGTFDQADDYVKQIPASARFGYVYVVLSTFLGQKGAVGRVGLYRYRDDGQYELKVLVGGTNNTTKRIFLYPRYGVFLLSPTRKPAPVLDIGPLVSSTLWKCWIQTLERSRDR